MNGKKIALTVVLIAIIAVAAVFTVKRIRERAKRSHDVRGPEVQED